MGWTETYSLKTQKRHKCLLKEIFPRFGLPKSLQSNNGSSFVAKITQQATTTLGVSDHLHASWRPPSSRELEKANHKEDSGEALARDFWVLIKVIASSVPPSKSGSQDQSPTQPLWNIILYFWVFTEMPCKGIRKIDQCRSCLWGRSNSSGDSFY